MALLARHCFQRVHQFLTRGRAGWLMIGKEDQEAQGRDGQEKKAVNNVLPAPPASPRVGTAWEDVVGGTVLLLHLWPGVPCDELARSHIDFVEDAPNSGRKEV